MQTTTYLDQLLAAQAACLLAVAYTDPIPQGDVDLDMDLDT